jgi:hypothetical protein
VGIAGRWVAPRDYGDIHLGFYNGETYSRPEANDQKAFQMRASLRPLPRSAMLKGLRFSGFLDSDRPISTGERDRHAAAMTFEHRFANVGLEYLRASDRANATAKLTEAEGFSAWITPRTPFGLEALLRYDRMQPDRTIDARRSRAIVGTAYWFRTMKSPLAAAVMAEYEHAHYDGAMNKPEENRWALKTLFNF